LLGEAQKTAAATESLADVEVDGVSQGCAPLFAAVYPTWARRMCGLVSTTRATHRGRELRRVKGFKRLQDAFRAKAAPFWRHALW
jgi:hypothetical protein